jgi:NAD dependent epimerase/dehydratase family enzyme
MPTLSLGFTMISSHIVRHPYDEHYNALVNLAGRRIVCRRYGAVSCARVASSRAVTIVIVTHTMTRVITSLCV